MIKLLHFQLKNYFFFQMTLQSTFFHTTIQQGDLGITSLRTLVPLLRIDWSKNLNLPKFEGGRPEISFFSKQLDETSKRLNFNGSTLYKRNDVDEYWASELYNMIDAN